jgi:hypothetical protein
MGKKKNLILFSSLPGVIVSLPRPAATLHGAIASLHRPVATLHGVIAGLHRPIETLHGAFKALQIYLSGNMEIKKQMSIKKI